jgi:uncharacterized protein (TIGR03437 family)
MRTISIGAVLFLTGNFILPAQPTPQPVLSWAQGLIQSSSPFPPGGFVVLRGTGFTIQESQALAAPYPKKLGGVSISANGIACPLVSVSPTRAVILLPYALADAESLELSLILSNDSGSTEPFSWLIGLRPTILTADREEYGPAVVLDESLAPLTQVTTGQTVILPIFGLGATDPPVADGAATPATDPLPVVVHPIRVFFGDAEAQVLTTTLAPGQVGLYHAKVVVPEGGDGSVAVMTDNRELHRVNLPAAPPPPSVTLAAASIESIFGSEPLPPVTWTPVLTAARFTVSLTLAAQARPFLVELKGPAGGVTVHVDPTSATWVAASTVPTAPTRAGDFSQTSLSVYDFTSGVPFPGKFVPVVRIPPHYLTAFQQLPLPNQPTLDGSAGLLNQAGTIPAEGPLTLDFATANWVPLALNGSERAKGSYSAVYTLFVDGKETSRFKLNQPIAP